MPLPVLCLALCLELSGSSDLERTRSLAKGSRESLADRPQRALLLAVEGLRRAGNEAGLAASAQAALREALSATSGVGLSGHQNTARAIAMSSRGHWLATGDWAGGVQLWDLASTDPAEKPAGSWSLAQGVDVLGISADERWMAAGDLQGGIYLWDFSEGIEASPTLLRPSGSLVRRLVFSPEGSHLTVAASDGVTEWKLPNSGGSEVNRSSLQEVLIDTRGRRLVLLEQSGRLRILNRTGAGWTVDAREAHISEEQQPEGISALSADGRWLFLSGRQGSLWDLEAGSLEPRILAGIDGRGVGGFDPHSQRLVTGDIEGLTRIWKLENPESSDPILLTGHSGWVSALAFSPDGNWLATGSTDRTVRLWDLRPESHTHHGRVLRGNDSGIFGLAFSPDGRWLVAGAGAGRSAPRLWDLMGLDRFQEPRTLSDGTQIIAAKFVPDGRWLATGSLHGQVRLWDLRSSTSGSGMLLFPGLGDAVPFLSVSADSRWLAAHFSDPASTTLLWSLDPEGKVGDGGTFSNVREHDFDPKGRWMALGGFAGTIWLYDLHSKDPRASRRMLYGYESRVEAVAFSPEGDFLLTSDGRDTHLWSVEGEAFEGTPIHRTEDAPSLEGAIFSPDGSWLATSCSEAGKCLYPFSGTARLQKPFLLRGGLAIPMEFTSDSRLFATGGNDGAIRLWTLSGGNPEEGSRVLRGHEGQVLRLAASRDGRWLASAALDRAPRLWDLHSADPEASGVPLAHESRPMLSFDGRLRGMYDLAFSPDSHRLATVGLDGVVRLWELDLERLVERACQIAGRNLSLEEWQQFLGADTPYSCTCPSLPPAIGVERCEPPDPRAAIRGAGR